MCDSPLQVPVKAGLSLWVLTAHQEVHQVLAWGLVGRNLLRGGAFHTLGLLMMGRADMRDQVAIGSRPFGQLSLNLDVLIQASDT
jgi:hypothetical protein